MKKILVKFIFINLQVNNDKKMKVINYLNQPYKLPSNKWGNIILISFLIGFFILIFQPFGLNNYQTDYKSMKLLGFGLVTFIVASLNQLIIPQILPKQFDATNWTIKKNSIYILWIFFTIGLGNLLYIKFISPHQSIAFVEIITIQIITLIIGIFPVAVSISIFQNIHQVKINKQLASELTNALENEKKTQTEDQQIIISSENEKESIKINLSNLLYIESIGNYVHVTFLKDSKIEQQILRNTLKNLENSLSSITTIKKCHRAFLINLNNVSKITGNTQGCKVHIQEIEIPVSRNYIKEFKEQLN